MRLEVDDGRVAAAMAIAERIETYFSYCTGSNEAPIIKRINEDHPCDIWVTTIGPNALGAARMRD